MARGFLARLIDFGCDFSLRDLENRRVTPGFRPVSKNRFSILQTIVHYRTDIRQPEKKGGLRKIEIAGIDLAGQCRVCMRGIAGSELSETAGGLNIVNLNQCITRDRVWPGAVMGEIAHQLMPR
ncbi:MULTISPECIES: hypothetical protein [unclassified Burkholderia]|uniref:hypothetical protein n=1 Tax=unclassified Burkholderia TaxID=2613784 RepID=UPI000AF1156F|nr:MULTISPECIES: hypothetical protein [unclassified Burkholderia]